MQIPDSQPFGFEAALSSSRAGAAGWRQKADGVIETPGARAVASGVVLFQGTPGRGSDIEDGLSPVLHSSGRPQFISVRIIPS